MIQFLERLALGASRFKTRNLKASFSRKTSSRVQEWMISRCMRYDMKRRASLAEGKRSGYLDWILCMAVCPMNEFSKEACLILVVWRGTDRIMWMTTRSRFVSRMLNSGASALLSFAPGVALVFFLKKLDSTSTFFFFSIFCCACATCTLVPAKTGLRMPRSFFFFFRVHKNGRISDGKGKKKGLCLVCVEKKDGWG